MWYPVADEGQGLVAAGLTSDGDSLAAVADEAKPSADELSDWAQHFFSLEAKVAGKLGFGVGSVAANHQDKVVIAEFSRSKGVTSAAGNRPLRFGVALRLIIKVTSTDASGSLNLPMIAAETQLGRISTESHLAITGYAGESLAKLIPPWKQFDVQSYVELMQSVTKIQELIASDIKNIRPTLLQIYETATEEDDDEEGRQEAVGIVWAMTRIMNGDPLRTARDTFPVRSSDAGLRGIAATYADLVGGDDSYSPSEEQRDTARRALGKRSDWRSWLS